MLAPNPDTKRPARRQPWETPADLPACELMGYGHRVALEMGIRHASRHFTAAEHVRARPVAAMTWAGGLIPFANYAEAARFVVGAGKSTQSLKTTATVIMRATARGVDRYGLRWSPEKINA